ncbi:putative Ulp1 protease family catalytic domain, papain-like cysteine peptidase superfamily [Helianthus anomalus]
MFSFTSYFYKESEVKKRNRCAFLNVNAITGDMCQRNPKAVTDHILSLATHHIDKDFILAPYLAKNHWSLFIIAQHIRHVYILDSTKIKCKRNALDYRLSSLIPTALGYQFDYTMVDTWHNTREATDNNIDTLLRKLMPKIFTELGISLV